MKTILPLLVIALLLFQNRPILSGADSSADEQSIVFLREEWNSSGVPNKKEKIHWRRGLTLGQVLLIGGAQLHFHAGYSVVSNRSITFYSGQVALNPSALEDQVYPGDVVVFGSVDLKRAGELDKVPEINQRLGVKWSECKNRVRRKIESPANNPSQKP
jgi:hypothetical protein